jgi:hypothetical protein
MKMSFKDFLGRRPHLSFIALGAVCIGIGLVVTQVQANISESAVKAENNPHHLPDEFNPNFQRLEDKLREVKLEVKEAPEIAKEEVTQDPETLHSLALKGNTASTKVTYDYTTGTSN